MKTNSTVKNKQYGWDEDVLVKPFRCSGKEVWHEVTRPTKGILILYPETMQIEVEIVSGCHPEVGDIFNFLLKDKDVQTLIHMYQQKGRVIPFSINCTGRSDNYFINFTDKTGLIIKRKHLLHVSYYDKIAEIKKMYIGDFCEVLAYMKKNHAFELATTSCKYEKPYFADEKPTTKISKIL